MKLYRHYDGVPSVDRGAVAAVGNFDGLHLGHQAVIAEAVRLARAVGKPSAVISFEPHPYGVFHRAAEPFRLTPFRIKAELLERLDLDLAFFLTFDQALYTKSPQSFVADVLCQGIGISHLVVGNDFVFGHRRAGDVDLLAGLAREQGFALSTFEKISDTAGLPYSSTKVRRYLAAGQPHLASAQLGRAWAIEGRVESGDQRGRTIGFPTANLGLGEYLVPALGVYAVRAATIGAIEPIWRDGVANIGLRPTVDGSRLLLEVHLFDFAGDLYGQHLRVALIDYLREEKKFDGIDELRAQIARDADDARRSLAGEQMVLEIGMRRPPVAAVKRIV